MLVLFIQHRDKSKTENERDNLSQRVTTLDEENRRLRKELNEEKTKRSLMADEVKFVCSVQQW